MITQVIPNSYQPIWGGSNTLSAASRAALREVDLRFHDLRHEAGSHLIEEGGPIHHVKNMLGHQDLSQTSTYLNATDAGMQESMRRRDERRVTAEPLPVCKAVAKKRAIGHAPLCNEADEQGQQVQIN